MGEKNASAALKSRRVSIRVRAKICFVHQAKFQVQLAADTIMTSLQIAQSRHARHYRDLIRGLNKLYKEGGLALNIGLDRFDLELANIQAAQAWAVSQADDNDDAATVCRSFPRAGASLINLRLPSAERLRWIECGLASAQRLGQRQAESYHLMDLGMVYAARGEIRRAVEFHEQALKIQRELGGWLGESAPLGNLGNAYVRLKEPRRAIEFYEWALAYYRETGEQRGEAYAFNNLGVAHTDLDEFPRVMNVSNRG